MPGKRRSGCGANAFQMISACIQDDLASSWGSIMFTSFLCTWAYTIQLHIFELGRCSADPGMPLVVDRLLKRFEIHTGFGIEHQ